MATDDLEPVWSGTLARAAVVTRPAPPLVPHTRRPARHHRAHDLDPRILEALAAAPRRADVLARDLGVGHRAIQHRLTALRCQGRVDLARQGGGTVWRRLNHGGVNAAV